MNSSKLNMSKRKRTGLTVQFKRTLLREVDEGLMKKTDICRKYDVPNSTLSTILKYRARIEQSSNTFKEGRRYRIRHKQRGDSLKSRSPTKASGLVKSESMKEHRIKQNASEQDLRDKSESSKSEDHMSSRTKSSETQTRVSHSSSGEPLQDGTGLHTRIVSDHIIHNERMIEELSDSSDSPNVDNLETDIVAFSSQPASFHNSKLTNSYELNAAPRTKSKAFKEKKHSLHNLSPPSPRSGGILKTSASRQLAVNSTTTKHPQSEHQSNARDFLDSETSHRVGQPEQQSTKPLSRPSVAHIDQRISHEKSPEDIASGIMIAKASPSTMSDRESPRPVSMFPNAHLPIIEEVKTEVAESSQLLSSVELQAVEKEDVLSDLGFGSSQHSADSSWDSMERQIRLQKESIEALHRRVQELTATVDNSSCVFPTKYQDMTKPEMVEIYCDKPEGSVTKRFLLDNGRLKLETVKLAFDLITVELWLDGIPCILSSNIDGYIPMKFSPSSKLHISGLSHNGHQHSSS